MKTEEKVISIKCTIETTHELNTMEIEELITKQLKLKGKVIFYWGTGYGPSCTILNTETTEEDV